MEWTQGNENPSFEGQLPKGFSQSRIRTVKAEETKTENRTMETSKAGLISMLVLRGVSLVAGSLAGREAGSGPGTDVVARVPSPSIEEPTTMSEKETAVSLILEWDELLAEELGTLERFSALF